MFFVIVGEYFSARYFMSSIAKTLFIRKKNKNEVEKNKESNIDSFFEKIEIGVI